MTNTTTLAERVAVNIRREMAAQNKKPKDLADALGLKYRAALDRHQGKTPYSLAQTEAAARWLGVSANSLAGELQAAA